MDEGTRDAIDALLASKGRRPSREPIGPAKRPPRPIYTKATRTHFGDLLSGTMDELFKEPKVEIREHRSWDTSEVSNLKEHVASLSMDPARACIVMRAVYNHQFLDALYAKIPSTNRMWNNRDSVWEIHPKSLSTLKSLLKEWYQDVVIVGVPKQVQATKFDQLISRLDKEDKAKIYRLLAAKYHPDAQKGDHETMVLINQVFKQ